MNITPEEIRHLLQHYSHVLLTAHVNPDGDAIGSLVAMQDYLERMGKQVSPSSMMTLTTSFSSCPVSASLKSRLLSIRMIPG